LINNYLINPASIYVTVFSFVLLASS